ncbi:hypothetical protein VQH23_24330 [Pararoseomonas sp. SCSIO 73927]|uniref:hypothetical protein n=1 Tax=Pararoseomonas sp. SCSIO 73927 TaxID=3114537 RepID=UPI0030CA962F
MRPALLALLAAAALATGAAAQPGKPDPAPPAGTGAAPSGKPEPAPSAEAAPGGKPAPAGPAQPDGGTSPAPRADAARGDAPDAASGDARTAAQEILRGGFIEGFFQTFWGSFRQSFVDSLVGRGHDRAAAERLAESTILPLFQRNRPSLEGRLLDVLSTALTPEQLQDVLRQARAGSAEGVRAGISRAQPAMETAIGAWVDEVMQANRAEITRGIQREGLR